MKYYTINDYTVGFDSETHQYLVDGKPVVSISQIVSSIYPLHYKNVDPELLKKASEKGNQLRDMIEAFERFGNKTYHPEMQGYLALKNQHQITVVESEKIVLLYHHGAVIAAGTFDMIVESPYIKGLGIADVKRMRFLHEERLKLQLNLYKLAYEQTYKKRINYLKCFHIRNRYHAYIDIAVDVDFTKKVLDRYITKNPIDYTY